MARTELEQAADLTAANVIHKRFSALPADATVAQVRDYELAVAPPALRVPVVSIATAP